MTSYKWNNSRSSYPEFANPNRDA